MPAHDLDNSSNVSTPARRWSNLRLYGRRKTPSPVPNVRTPSKESQANIFSSATFQWIAPLMQLGYHRRLELNDLWLVSSYRQTSLLGSKVKDLFFKNSHGRRSRPLLKALLETLRFDLYLGGICQLVASITQVLNPFVLRYLIRYANEAYVASRRNEQKPSLARGAGLVICITLLLVLQSLSTNQSIYRGMICGGQARSMLVSMLFDKSLRVSARARAGGRPNDCPFTTNSTMIDKRGKTRAHQRLRPYTYLEKRINKRSSRNDIFDDRGYSDGKIMNLMSVDAYRVDCSSSMLHVIWTAPITISLSFVLLVVNLGAVATLCGFAFLLFITPIIWVTVNILIRFRKNLNQLTDRRSTQTQELLSSIRLIKVLSWENNFLQIIQGIRTAEFRGIRSILAVRNGTNAVSGFIPYFASAIAFLAFSLLNSDFPPDKVFSSLALFNAIRLPLNLLPVALGQVTDGMSSIERIQTFLLAEETVDETVTEKDHTIAFDLRKATFTWERSPSLASSEKSETSKAFSIDNIALSLKKGELVAIIGEVGSGKSSLLATLAGEMRKTGGTMTRSSSSCAFCPQSAWIQNTTIKENILFGAPLCEHFYNQVLDACCLRPDFEMLPNGDLTEVGERGVTISGGQKQRISIARAIYFNSALVLLDDPLSAVDAQVGHQLFDKALCGMLKGSTCILATHQLWVLPRCDRIIWMHQGQIRAIDTYSNLRKNDSGFAGLLSSNSWTDAPEEDRHRKRTLEGPRTVSTENKCRSLIEKDTTRDSPVPSWSLYHTYLRATGSVWVLALTLCLLALCQGSIIASSLWLLFWTSNKFDYPKRTYIIGYMLLNVLQTALMFVFAITISGFGSRAGNSMYFEALKRVLHAPTSFFDTTPLGTIANCLCKDIDTLDNFLPDSLRLFLITIGLIIAVFAVAIAFYKYFPIALVPLLIISLLATGYYRRTAREIKRHEHALRDRLFARLSEGVSGSTVIRAYGLQPRFSGLVREALDQMNGAYFLTFADQRWLGVRLDLVGTAMVFVIGILVVTSGADASSGGLVLSYMLIIVQMIQLAARQFADLENNMKSAERMHRLALDAEGEEMDVDASSVAAVAPKWPPHGEIRFQSVDMRYRPELPLVLKGLDLHIRAGEHVGIVGRTGAGKSSIVSAVFRLAALSRGSITIDGIDIAKLRLSDLRSRLAIIPQDTTLFRGTVRSNLDPFGRHSDMELWDSLRSVELISEPPNMGNQNEAEEGEQISIHASDAGSNETLKHPAASRMTLESQVDEGGLNFSLGQRQLLALARALVRQSQIIVCDEATSGVDVKREGRVWLKMKDRAFRGRTVLCIAHRLETVIGFDRVVVVDAGRVVEVGTPAELHDLGNGIFRSMCDKSGISKADVEKAREQSFEPS